MAIIEINGEVQQRADNTATWNYVNPVLEFKQLGWEYDNNVDKNPVGVKMGDGVTSWDDLPYWFTFDGSIYELLSNKTATQSSSATLYPNWLGVTNYLANFLTIASAASTYITPTSTNTLTNKSISGATNTLTAIPNSALDNSTISGKALGTNLSNHTAGTGLSGGIYNGSASVTWTLNLNNANTWTAQQSGVTPSANDNSTKFATTAYVDAATKAADIRPYRAITAATTILVTDYTINVTSGTFNQPLLATPTTGQLFNIKNSGIGTVTVTATSIDGATSVVLASGSSLQVQYTGVSGTYIIL